MRISTAMMHNNAVNAMMQRQADLSQSQNQVSSGKKVTKPSDDPAAAVRIVQLEQQQAAVTQYGTNIGAVQTRLQLSEQALTSGDSIIQRVSELAIQANSSTLSSTDKQAIATELTQLNQQLLDLANSKDSNGEYLYAGYSSRTQPFSRNGAGTVVYSGDQAARNVQVSASQYMTDGDTGQSVFMAIPDGNGTFSLSANAANTGSAVITGQVQNRAAWVPDNYTLTFSSATDWQVTDSATPANVVASGSNYAAGNAITFNGVSVSLTGAPAAGDTFTVAQSQNKDVFSTIDALVSALKAPSGTAAEQAQYQNAVNAVQSNLSQAETSLLGVRSSVGARLASLQTVETTRQNTSDEITTSLSNLQDIDYAQAASQLSQQYIGLQAAQQSYAKIAQLSLFNYL